MHSEDCKCIDPCQSTKDEDKPEGFWRELFLLKPDISELGQILDETDPEFLLQFQHYPQQFFANAVIAVGSGKAPADENALEVRFPLM